MDSLGHTSGEQEMSEIICEISHGQLTLSTCACRLLLSRGYCAAFARPVRLAPNRSTSPRSLVGVVV